MKKKETNDEMDLEMDFTDGLSATIDMIRIAVARDQSRGFLANDLRSLLGFGVYDDLVGSMNLVIGKDAILKHEPARSPSFAIVHPLVQNPGDSVPDEVFDPDVHSGGNRQGVCTAAFTAVGEGVEGLSSSVSRVGSGCGGDRGHVESDRRGVVGDYGDTAEGMH